MCTVNQFFGKKIGFDFFIIPVGLDAFTNYFVQSIMVQLAQKLICPVTIFNSDSK